MDSGEVQSLRLADIEAAHRLLREVPKSVRLEGESLVANGMVESVVAVVDELEFEGRVRGSRTEVHQVELYYDDMESEWFADCDCERGQTDYLCCHGYALLKHLVIGHNQAEVHDLSSGRKGRAGTNTPPKSALGGSSSSPSKPSETFDVTVERSLGRRLKPAEEKLLFRIAEIRQRFAINRSLFVSDLLSLGFRVSGSSWDRLDAVPQMPASDHELWLYIAHYLKTHGMEVPECLRGVSDTSEVAERVDRWRRDREVQQWREFLGRTGELEPAATTGGTGVELRLRLTEEEALCEWRLPDSEKFTVIKPTKYNEFDERHGTSLSPDVALLWQAVVQRARLGYSVSLPYHEAFTRDLLNRVLRLPTLEPHIVGEYGEVLQRVPEPLQWKMVPAEDASGDYRLTLVQADGSKLPPLVARLRGRTMLYVTTSAVYTGPNIPEGALNIEKETRIPAPALETREGVRFLQGLQVPLPPRLQSRVRTVPLTPVFRAEIGAPYAGSETEYCMAEVFSVDPAGTARERWNGSSWVPFQPPSRSTNPRPSELVAAESETFEILDRSLLSDLTRAVEPSGFKWDFMHGKWSLRVTKKFPESFVPFIQGLPSHVKVELRGELASLARAEVAGEVSLDVQESGIDWFDLKVLVNVSDTELTPAEIKLLLDARGKWVRLGEKGWRRLEFKLSKEEDEELARLGLNPHEMTSEPQRLHALQLADPAAKRFLDEEKFEHVQRRAREIKARVTPDLPPGIKAELRPYQRDGFHFLAYLSSNHFGGILADDMGLGKTLQTLTWLAWLRTAEGAAGTQSKGDANSPDGAPLPSLVVCPKSVCDNWRAEAEKFLSGLRVRVWATDDVKSLPAMVGTADLHIINYAQLRTVGEGLARTDFQAVILDEGQYIKNPSSQTAMVARMLRSEHRLVLSGTPIENRLLDLWSLMSFAMPGALGSRAEFARLFDAKDDPFARRRLSARVRPFLLRRTKAQVARDLPDRIEEDLFCELEGEQKTMYKAELKRTQAMLLGIKTAAALNKQRFNVLTSLLRLRQICCHPRLLKPDSKAPSAKLEALVETIEPLMEEGQKVLVFSQFVEALDLLRNAVTEQGWKCFFLSGETENRGDLVREFQAHEGAAVFLISLKAGGFGLNLTAASYVVLFDPWWNPAVENQAIDRTHRIGQTQKVMAYRLLIKDSIEEKIRLLQQTKSQLAEDVLGEEKFSQGLTLDDLQFLFAD